MATYSEITSTKTITLDADGGTNTLTYYAGNKNNTTGSVVGNADKKTITYNFDTAASWVSSISFTNKDDTAKNITVVYAKNESTSSRQVNFKLKDQTSLYYLILKQSGSTPAMAVGTKYTFKWYLTHRANPSSSRDVPSVIIYYKENTEIFGIINPNGDDSITWDKAFIGQPSLSKEYTTELAVVQVKPLTSGNYNIVPCDIICGSYNTYNAELECSFGTFYLNISNTTALNITFNISGSVYVQTHLATISIYIDTICSC